MKDAFGKSKGWILKINFFHYLRRNDRIVSFFFFFFFGSHIVDAWIVLEILRNKVLIGFDLQRDCVRIAKFIRRWEYRGGGVCQDLTSPTFHRLFKHLSPSARMNCSVGLQSSVGNEGCLRRLPISAHVSLFNNITGYMCGLHVETGHNYVETAGR